MGKTSMLPWASALKGNELIEIEQGGAPKKIIFSPSGPGPGGSFVWGTGTGNILDQGDLVSYVNGLPVKAHTHSADDITTGVLPALRGGTGIKTYIAGQLLVAANTSTLSTLNPGTNGYVLTILAGMPVWAISPASPWGVEVGKIYYTAGKVGIGTNAPDNLLTIKIDDLTAEPTDGLLLTNKTDASVGSTQFSPGLFFEASSILATTAVKHKLRIYLKPVASGGNTALMLDFKRDAGVWTNMASFLSSPSSDSANFASGVKVGANLAVTGDTTTGSAFKITGDTVIIRSASLLPIATTPRNAMEVSAVINTGGGAYSPYTLRGFFASHVITSAAPSSLFIAFANTNGDNYFNSTAGQTGIGVAERNIESSAKFQVSSNTRGSLPAPKMSTSGKNAISDPIEGLMVYDTDLHKYSFRNGTAWETIGGGGSSIVDISSTTVTGWSSFTTKKIYYQLEGKVLRLFFHLEGTGTGSSSYFNLSALTASTDLPEQWNEMKAINSGTSSTGYSFIAANSGQINLYRGSVAANWSSAAIRSCIGTATILVN